MTQEDQRGFEQALSKLRKKFVDSLFTHVLDLEQSAEFMRRNGGCETNLRAVSDVLHKLAGVAPTLGFTDIGTGARRIEVHISEALNNAADPGALWHAIEPHLEAQMNRMEKILDDVMEETVAA